MDPYQQSQGTQIQNLEAIQVKILSKSRVEETDETGHETTQASVPGSALLHV